MAGGVGFFKKASPVVPCEGERDTKDGICTDGTKWSRSPGCSTNQDLKRLILPLIVEQILAVSVGMVDTMMVSNAGEAATSGVSLVDMVNTLFINIFAAVATGGAVVSSQYLGQRRRDRACQSANQLILITACHFTCHHGALHPVPPGGAAFCSTAAWPGM